MVVPGESGGRAARPMRAGARILRGGEKTPQPRICYSRAAPKTSEKGRERNSEKGRKGTLVSEKRTLKNQRKTWARVSETYSTEKKRRAFQGETAALLKKLSHRPLSLCL